MSSCGKENANNSKEDMQELSALYEKAGTELEEEYYSKVGGILDELGLFEPNHGPVPPEIWFGIAQAIADASGYRLVLAPPILTSENNQVIRRLRESRRSRNEKVARET